VVGDVIRRLSALSRILETCRRSFFCCRNVDRQMLLVSTSVGVVLKTAEKKTARARISLYVNGHPTRGKCGWAKNKVRQASAYYYFSAFVRGEGRGDRRLLGWAPVPGRGRLLRKGGAIRWYAPGLQRSTNPLVSPTNIDTTGSFPPYQRTYGRYQQLQSSLTTSIDSTWFGEAAMFEIIIK